MRPVRTDTAGSTSGGRPMVSKSLSRLAASAKSPTSIDGAERVLQRHALQFERQRAERALDVAEGVARLRPFALPGKRERAPQRRVVLVADHRIGEVLQRGLGAAEHDVGDGAQHERRRILGGRPLVGDRDVEHGLGFGIHLAREIEPREIERAAAALAVRRFGRGADQLGVALGEVGVAVEAPGLRVEGQRA